MRFALTAKNSKSRKRTLAASATLPSLKFRSRHWQKFWDDFCQGIALWKLFGFGGLSVEETEERQCIGRAEINFGSRYPEPVLGWMLFETSQEDRGFALDAARAVRDWAMESDRIKSLVSYIDPDNLRSQRLAARLSATLDENAAKQDPGDVVYRHF